MRRYAALFLILGLAVGFAQAGKTPKPELRLRVSTHSGEIPLDLELKGHLINVDLEKTKACYIRSEWTYESPAGITFQSAIEEVPCSGKKDGPIPREFVKELLIEQPGTYSYRIIIEPLEGRRKAGTSQEVVVYRSKFEASVTLREEE